MKNLGFHSVSIGSFSTISIFLRLIHEKPYSSGTQELHAEIVLRQIRICRRGPLKGMRDEMSNLFYGNCFAIVYESGYRASGQGISGNQMHFGWKRAWIVGRCDIIWGMDIRGKKNKFIVSALIIALLLIIALVAVILLNKGRQPGASENGNEESKEPLIKASSVMVECGDQVGCGNVYECSEDAIIIVTARHILEDAKAGTSAGDASIQVTFYDGEASQAKLIKEDSGLDVAFLEINKKELPAHGLGYQAVAMTSSDVNKEYGKPDATLNPGTNIYLRNALKDQVYAGTIELPSVYSEDFGTEVILCYCVVDDGMSGTGLFDEENNYLGMLLGSTEDGEAVCLDVAGIKAIAPRK